MDVLLVLAAIEVLDMGAAGAGYLSAAIGLGWIVGGATTLVIVGRPRLTPLTLVGAFAWACRRRHRRGGTTGVAGVLTGTSRVGCRRRRRATVLQRLVPTNRLAVVFGIAEGASMAGAAVGALAAGVLVAASASSARSRLPVVLLPVVAVATLRTIARSEAAVPIPFREIALLRRLPLFAPVPAPALEAAAAALVPAAVAAGTAIIREGDIGDRCYISRAAQARLISPVSSSLTLGPGQAFGERALIRDIPRTASVVAVTDVRVLALERGAFMLAVTASPRAVSEAARIAARQLDADARSRPDKRPA